MSGGFDQTLADTFYFDEADLEANRSLRMSAAQQRRMQQGAKMTRAHLPKVLAVLGVGLALVIVFIAMQAKGSGSQLTLVAVLVAGSFVAVAAFATRTSRATARRLEAGAVVKSVSGPLFIRQPGFKLSSTYRRYLYDEVGIADVTFLLDREDSAVLEDGAQYRIFYAEPWGNGINMILSLERL